MKYVPLKRLLLQPTVQLKWIEQHGDIEFLLADELQSRFSSLWASYKASGEVNIKNFLMSDDIQRYELHEDDELFSLLIGADYIQTQHPRFSFSIHQPNLVWRIKAVS